MGEVWRGGGAGGASFVRRVLMLFVVGGLVRSCSIHFVARNFGESKHLVGVTRSF